MKSKQKLSLKRANSFAFFADTDERRVEDIRIKLYRLGFHGLADMIDKLVNEIAAAKEEIEDLEDREREVVSDFKSRISDFFYWFREDFESTIKVKQVGKKKFHILTEEQMNELKETAHAELEGT